MQNTKLFKSYYLGGIELKNRIVMSPMTRSRAEGNEANALMAKYYSQRADAGLIITEGTSPSPNGLGYCRIPGIFSNGQTEGWKQVTQAVHNKGGKIFVQLMHTGRIGHPLNMPKGARIIAPSAVKAAGQIWTDVEGLQDYIMPEEMTHEDISRTRKEYVQAANNAVSAGFNGVELHGANGYLLEQFLSPATNLRTDAYGGNIKNRCRFILETVDEICQRIGKYKVGIRLSPYGITNDMAFYSEIDDTYNYLTEELNKRDIVYIHLVDHSSMGAPEVPDSIKKSIRKNFRNALILSGGFTKARAEEVLQGNMADLIAFGRPFIINPDLVQRLMKDKPLATELDPSTFYTPGAKGYTDYPTMA